MTLTIRIANHVRRSIPIVDAQIEYAARLIKDAMPTLRESGPVAVTLTDGCITHILHRD